MTFTFSDKSSWFETKTKKEKRENQEKERTKVDNQARTIVSL